MSNNSEPVGRYSSRSTGIVNVRAPHPNLDGAFEAARRGRAQGLVVLHNPLISTYRRQVVDMGLRDRLSEGYYDRRPPLTPWLRINHVLRVILHTRWSVEAWFVPAAATGELKAPDGRRADRLVVGWYQNLLPGALLV